MSWIQIIKIAQKNLSNKITQNCIHFLFLHSDVDICLLDDPLSAVDSHVGRHIFDHVIGPEGLLADKTRIVVTNAVNFLAQVDEILVIKDGEIAERGTYQELLNQQGPFAQVCSFKIIFFFKYLKVEKQSMELFL